MTNKDLFLKTADAISLNGIDEEVRVRISGYDYTVPILEIKTESTGLVIIIDEE